MYPSAILSAIISFLSMVGCGSSSEHTSQPSPETKKSPAPPSTLGTTSTSSSTTTTTTQASSEATAAKPTIATAIKAINLFRSPDPTAPGGMRVDIEVLHDPFPAELDRGAPTYVKLRYHCMIFVQEDKRSVFEAYAIESFRFSEVSFTTIEGQSIKMDLQSVKSNGVKSNVDLSKEWQIDKLPVNPKPRK